MDLIFTSYKGVYRIDTDTEKIHIIHSGEGMYYGVTWNKHKIYVAARRSISDYKLGDERIFVFDKDLKLVGKMPQQLKNHGLHEILIDPTTGLLWATASLQNKIVMLGVDGSTKSYYPNAFKNIDHNHFNSLCLVGGNMLITAHNNGKKDSEIYKCSIGEKPKVIKKYKMKGCTHSHNCFILDGELCTCASEESAVKTKEGHSLFDVKFGGYTRGVVIGKREIVVGVSARAIREDRIQADGNIFIFDRDTRELKKKIDLPKIGQVAEIRALSDPDDRHWPDPILG